MCRTFSYLGETDCSFTKIVPATRVSLRNTLRGNPKQAFRTNKRRLFPISTNEKRTLHALRNVLEMLAPQANPNCTNYMAEAIAVSGNVPAAAERVGMIPKKGVGQSPHPS